MRCIIKKVFTVLTIFILSTVLVNAQGFAKKGTWEIGGNIGFFSSTPVVNGETQDSYSDLSLSAYTGYFIIDGLELGFAPFSYSVHTPASGDNSTNISILLAPSYNFDLKSNLFPFIEGLVGYTSMSSGSYKASGLTWGVRGGVKIVIVKNALINAGVQYTAYNYTPEGADNRYGTNQISINAGFAVIIP